MNFKTSAECGVQTKDRLNLLHRNGVGPTCGSFDTHGFLHFSVSLQTNKLNVMTTPYTDYQLYLYERITKLRKEGLGYRKISNLFNKEGLKTCRGKRFGGNSIHSILKKKNIRDVRLNKKFKTKISKFELKYN